MNKTYLAVGASVASAAVSFYVGWKVAESQLNKYYNEQMEAEIARTRAFYERMNKSGPFESPLTAAEALGVTGDQVVANAADALLAYKGGAIPGEQVVIKNDGVVIVETEKVQDVEIAAEQHNIFDDVEEDEDEIDMSDRDPAKPYQITKLEFLANDSGFDQVEVVFFEGDKVVADDDQKPMSDVAANIGLNNLLKFGDSSVMYIRNERIQMEYQVLRNDGKYMHEVAGLQHSDEPFQRTRRTRLRDE